MNVVLIVTPVDSSHVVGVTICVASGFLRCVNDILAVLGFYAMQLPTLWDNLSVHSVLEDRTYRLCQKSVTNWRKKNLFSV